MATDWSLVGGTVAVRAGGDPKDPGDAVVNFGIIGEPGRPGVALPASAFPRRDFDVVAPQFDGRWDGKTTICIPEMFRRVTGKDPAIQYQVNGTCGGRAARNVINNVQAVMIGAGKKAKFRPASHAWPYFLARLEYNMLRPSGPRGIGDGVASGSIPSVLAKYGALHAEEAKDTADYGPGSDALAIAWGAGNPRPPKELFDAARDNGDFDWADCRSARNVADALAAGGCIIASDQHGFTEERDKDGFCQLNGVWYHYHTINGVVVTRSGRKGFSYEQSWNLHSPRGSNLLMDGAFPANNFGIEWDAMDDICRKGRVAALFGFKLWDADNTPEIDWRRYFI